VNLIAMKPSRVVGEESSLVDVIRSRDFCERNPKRVIWSPMWPMESVGDVFKLDGRRQDWTESKSCNLISNVTYGVCRRRFQARWSKLRSAWFSGKSATARSRTNAATWSFANDFEVLPERSRRSRKPNLRGFAKQFNTMGNKICEGLFLELGMCSSLPVRCSLIF
jgi:hypothetical protein